MLNQQIFAPEDLLSGRVVVDEISVEQKNVIQKFLEDKYSPKVDAIVKDFDDDPDEENHYSRTYLRRSSPLQFSLSIGGKNLEFFVRFHNTNHYDWKSEPATYNEVVVYFEDGITTRSAYGTKAFGSIQRKRKIKYISRLEQTIIGILDLQEKIASEGRISFLTNKLEGKKWHAQEKLRDLEDEYKNIQNFEKKYHSYFTPDLSSFRTLEDALFKKIEAEKDRLSGEGLL